MQIMHRYAAEWTKMSKIKGINSSILDKKGLLFVAKCMPKKYFFKLYECY